MKKAVIVLVILLIGIFLFGCTDNEKSALEKCDELQSSSVIYNCYSGVAIQTKDFFICEKIPDLSFKNACNRDVAIETEDELNCEKVLELYNNEKSMCYLQISRKKDDKTICNNITKEPLKAGCMNAVPY